MYLVIFYVGRNVLLSDVFTLKCKVHFDRLSELCVVCCVIDMFRVAALHQFIMQRLPAGIYGSDDDIHPSSRGFKIMSREDLRAMIDVAYAEVWVTV